MTAKSAASRVTRPVVLGDGNAPAAHRPGGVSFTGRVARPDRLCAPRQADPTLNGGFIFGQVPCP
ncbi:hypothetical protein [Chamaesiphon sp.]|uniref:hypothetical protein n=1 Tax=Chamaesiphon sp. TaxID=2814140 RepID=UPI003593511E